MTIRAKLTATFATLVAAFALCAGLVASAYANPSGSVTESSSGVTSLTLEKTLKVENATSLAEDTTVSFTATGASPLDNSVNGIATKQGLGTISINSITFTKNEDSDTSDGNYEVTKETTVTLPTPDSTWSPNTAYYYTITESGLANGFSASPTSLGLYLYTDNSTPTPKIVVATVVDPTTTNHDKTTLKFTNTYSSTAHKLIVTKHVSGNMSSTSDTFDFQITVKNGGANSFYQNGVTIPYTYQTDSSVTATSGNLTIGTATTVEDIKSTGTITIDIPDGLEFEVSELGIGTESGGNGYTPSLSSATGLSTTPALTTSGTTATTTATMGNSDVALTFTNTRQSSTITGIVLNNAPYIAVFTVAAAGLIAFILKRRRNAIEEE